MPRDLFDIQIDAEPGPLGYLDVAVHYFHRMDHDLFFPRLIELVEDFVDEEVRDGGV